MLRSYVIGAFRNLTGRRIPSLVNIFSLSISAVASLFLGEEIVGQLSFDDFHEKGDRIYRVVGKISRDGGAFDESRTGPPLAPLLTSEFPEIEQAVRLAVWGGTVRAGEKVFNETFMFADGSFFDVFSFDLVAGNPATALRDPFSVVISESTARRYFGDDDPMDRIVTYTSSVDHQPHEFTVRGVLRDTPKNSHIKVRLLAPLSSLRNLQGWGEKYFEQTWYWSPTWTYVLLSEALDSTDAMDRRLTELINNLGDRAKRWKSLGLERLEDIHLYSAAGGTGSGPAGGRWLVPAMIFFVVFVLLIACVNFTSMAMANASDRALEIGLRKALGCSRRHMIGQQLTEAILQSAIAVFVVIALTAFSLEFLGERGSRALLSFEFFATALVVVGVTGTAAGVYPALFYSAMQSPQALTGRIRSGSVGRLKRTFTVLQFSGSAIALITTFVIHDQLEAFRTTDLGFEPTGIISIPTQFRDQQTVEAFQHRLMADPRVLSATASLVEPGLDNSPMFLSVRSPRTDSDMYINTIYVGQRFAETMQIGMIEGDYTRTGELPVGALLINRAARERLGMDHASGHELEFFSGSGDLRHRVLEGSIAGVTEGFHYRLAVSQSLTQPLAMVVAPERCRYLLVRARDDDIPGLILEMESSWSGLFQGHEMVHRRLDWQIDKKYESLGRLVAAAGTGVITPILLIACIGLFGITAVSLGARKKDIAIRKVLGASLVDISALISREYVRLIGLSFIIAAPIVYLAVRILEEKVAFQSIPQNPLAYAGSFLIILAAALLTVNTLAVRAGRADPIGALRAA